MKWASTGRYVVRTGYQEGVASSKKTNDDRPSDTKSLTASVAPVPAVAAESEIVLPPGWRAAWDGNSSRNYYINDLRQASQWEAPPPYEHKDWSRHVSPDGSAYWQSGMLGLSFWEEAEHSGDWGRHADHEGRTYWSNESTDLRFFEHWPAVSQGRPGGA